MGFIIVTVVIVGAALFAWRFIFSPQAIAGSVRGKRIRKQGEQELGAHRQQPRFPQ